MSDRAEPTPDADPPPDAEPSSGTDGGARTVPATKYHGTGNDFLVVDAATADVPDRGAFAVRHCDRATGVAGGERTGADGVLFVDVDERFDPVRARMTLVQPDASIAEMCGNGARCAAAWVGERTGASVVDLDTPAGVRRATVGAGGGEGAGDTDGAVTVEVEMGRPSFDPADVPLAADRAGPLIEEDVAGLTVSAVDTGVPHAVAFVDSVGDADVNADDLGAVDLDAVAPAVRHADAFPEGANVTLAARTGDGTFDQRTYERGVEGETRACGTGAVAVGAVARRLGLADRPDLAVSPPGGTLRVSVPDDGPATLTGPAAREFDVDLAVPGTAADDGDTGGDDDCDEGEEAE